MREYTCDKCGKPASVFIGTENNVNQRLCEACNSRDVRLANLNLYRQQFQERQSLKKLYRGIPIIISVDEGKNLNGDYIASLDNPILGCKPGFGSTPARALRELGKHIADDADFILTKIKEHEFEIRQLEVEFGDGLPK